MPLTYHDISKTTILIDLKFAVDILSQSRHPLREDFPITRGEGKTRMKSS